MKTIKESIEEFQNAIDRNNQFIEQRQAENVELQENVNFLTQLERRFGGEKECMHIHNLLLHSYDLNNY